MCIGWFQVVQKFDGQWVVGEVVNLTLVETGTNIATDKNEWDIQM
jgi:hypothetical protein